MVCKRVFLLILLLIVCTLSMSSKLEEKKDTTCGRYIVVAKSTTSLNAIDDIVSTITNAGGEIHHSWYRSDRPVLRGFAATIPDKVLEQIVKSALIEYVEADGVVTALGSKLLTPPSN